MPGKKDNAALNYRFGDATTKETMRFLSAGEHKLRIWFPEKPEMATLDIWSCDRSGWIPTSQAIAHPLPTACLSDLYRPNLPVEKLVQYYLWR